MPVYSFFDEAGRFSHTVEGPMKMIVQPNIDAWPATAIEGLYSDCYWLHGGTPRKRPMCPVVVDGHVLRGVRPGSVITINEQRYECELGGDVELEFDQPGVYRVTVRRWPYLDGEYEIENPAQ